MDRITDLNKHEFDILFWFSHTDRLMFRKKGDYVYFYKYNSITLYKISIFEVIFYKSHLNSKMIDTIIGDYEIEDGWYKFFDLKRPFVKILPIFCKLEDNRIVEYKDINNEKLDIEWIQNEFKRYEETKANRVVQIWKK